jgi:DNA-binding NarL/FixJ family response regulator
MEKVSVVIADDHKMIAQAWATMVGLHPKLTVAGIFENTQDLLDNIDKIRPDIILLDINISPISGLDAIPFIRKLSPGSRIIGVSMHNQTAYAKRMIRNGARGYVTKSSEKDEMYKAIETVMQGEVYLCNEIRDLLTHQVLEEDKNPLSLLTEREIEVISLLKEGLSTNEIAERLFLSPRTVETHRARILKKLGLKNTVSLITYIQDHLSDLL